MGIFNGLRGMMGFQYTANIPMPIMVDQTEVNAQQYLNNHIAGAAVGGVTVFSGYYKVEVLQNALPYGMLSVNGFSGQVWYHTWHGAFIQEVDLD